MEEKYIKLSDAKKAIEDYRSELTMSKYGSLEASMDAKFAVTGAMKELDYIPAADVVPKSECAECAEKTRNTIVKLQGIINRLKKYDEQRDIELHARLIAETREKVASEIFEEIEKVLNLSKCYGDSGVYFEHDIETDIAELKKKYTEGE